jgi:hypothetical protein
MQRSPHFVLAFFTILIGPFTLALELWPRKNQTISLSFPCLLLWLIRIVSIKNLSLRLHTPMIVGHCAFFIIKKLPM